MFLAFSIETNSQIHLSLLLMELLDLTEKLQCTSTGNKHQPKLCLVSTQNQILKLLVITNVYDLYTAAPPPFNIIKKTYFV